MVCAPPVYPFLCLTQNGPGATLYLTLFGIAASFLSTFWAYGLTRLARQLRIYAQRGPQGAGGRIKKADVRARLWRSSGVNLAGIAATLLGLQATVGLLVAKTLTNATANPFLSGGSGSYNPVLALDVFLVQASAPPMCVHGHVHACQHVHACAHDCPCPMLASWHVPVLPGMHSHSLVFYKGQLVLPLVAHACMCCSSQWLIRSVAALSADWANCQAAGVDALACTASIAIVHEL